MITINSNTRQFNIPGADLVFGVVADSDAERKFFQCPRYVGDNLDLAGCFIRINYRNANGKTDFYLVDDMAIDGDNITFSWLLSPKVTGYRGQVKFVMCAVGPDLKLKWHTTQGTGQVMDGLEPDNSHVESQTADVVAQLIAMVEAQTSAVEVVGADQVAAVKAAAKTAQDSAVAEIEAKRSNSLNSIPDDYMALSAAVDALVREAAPGIVCSAEGEVITLNDASDQAFRGFRIFGKSTQDGVPTPEKPVEIVSIESPTISVDDQTLSIPLTLHGIPVTSGGNYTDATGQQWICDEVDLARGVYVQRVGVLTTEDLSVLTFAVNNSSANFTQYIGYKAFNHPPFDTASTSYPQKAYCNSFPLGAQVTSGTEKESFWIYADGSVLFVLNKNTSPDVVSAKEYILSHNPVIYYIIKTPIETHLSETELAAYRALHTNKPNSTILNDSGAYMSVDYMADTRLYIDNKIKEALQ